jgi:2-polyprenyl-6-methoxyphenol hydroxylase-like FAD-dependent oxidoreductase
MKIRKILIAGAGIGGLTLGIALRKLDFEVEVYEKTSKLEPIGWGIAIAPNALLALRHIDLDRSVLEAGHIIHQVQIKTNKNRILKEASLDALKAKSGASIVTINRGKLHNILQTAFGESGLHIGSGATGFKEEQNRVILTLENGQEVEGDLLIGADGIRSAIRRKLFPYAELHYSGYTAWRGISSETSLLPEGIYLSVLGCGMRFGCTSLGDGNITWYATYLTPPKKDKLDIDSPPTLLLQQYQNWCFPVIEIIASTPNSSIINTDVYDANPLTSWSSKHITLLGDAAHPMTPDMNQGAGQTIEDAIILASLLYKNSSLQEALSHYEYLRIPRTSKIVKQSRQSGEIEHIRNPFSCSLRNTMYALTPSELLIKQLVIVSRFEFS